VGYERDQRGWRGGEPQSRSQFGKRSERAISTATARRRSYGRTPTGKPRFGR
jgi:hypothetical protein